MEYMAKAKPGQNPAAGAHGGGVRGDQVNRGSRVFEGRFGRMFRTLPAAEFDSDALEALAWAMSAEPERDPKDDKKPAAAEEKSNESFHDGEENTGISAGYTYLGQFIDHDITFDPASSLQKQNDPDGLVDFRTPALDLDSVYGRGPEDQPYMYETNGKKFLLGRELTEDGTSIKPSDRTVPCDLPRFGGGIQNAKARAIIGDKRNDENVIVSQLHSTFLQFHNRLVDNEVAKFKFKNKDTGKKEADLTAMAFRSLDFKDIQRKVRWHYQYVVLNDFLPRIVGEATMNKVWPGWRKGNTCGNEPNLCLYHFHQDAYMPIEFAAAAYRFGHSMVRPIYRLNAKQKGGQDPKTASQDEINQGIAGRFFIFAGVQKRGLNGFDEFPADWAIDWSLYFDIKNLDKDGKSTDVGELRVQPAYKIDTSIVNPLAFLPEFSEEKSIEDAGSPLTLEGSPPKTDNLRPRQSNHRSPSNLAIRNLWRGNSMGLPSGQDVARAMGERVLKPDELVIGKAQVSGGKEEVQSLNDFVARFKDKDGNKIEKHVKDKFVGKAPLWYYVLAEAQAQWRKDKDKEENKNKDPNQIPVTLGPVGGRIVAETLIGLLLADSHSYLNQDPNWSPDVGGKWMRMQKVKNKNEEKEIWVPEAGWVPQAGEKADDVPRWKKFTMGDFVKYALKLP